MKTCRKCKIEKDVSSFNKQSATGDGLQVYCRSCQADAKSAWKRRFSISSAIPADPSDKSSLFTKKGARILIDADDYDRLRGYSWHLDRKGYVVRSGDHPDRPGKKCSIRMHREIFGLVTNDPRVVDHIDGNPTNNRKSNLRICSAADNSKNRKISRNNTTGFKGVSWDPTRKKWTAKIRINRVLRNIGYFDSPEKAHDAYRVAAVELHGQFCNFG